jgi:hypothetical protein
MEGRRKDGVEKGVIQKRQINTSKRLLNTATQELNKSSIRTKIIASKLSCKVLHQQNPLTILCEKLPRNKAGEETFSTTQDITRNLCKKQRQKSTRFRETLGKSFSAESLRKLT